MPGPGPGPRQPPPGPLAPNGAVDPEYLDANRFNPDILPTLELSVTAQVDNKTYFPNVNLTLLRFYQMYPDQVNPNLIVLILIKSLMAMPAPDFLLAQAMIPAGLQTVEPFMTLVNLYRDLENGRLLNFWSRAVAARELLEPIAGFEQAVQKYIIGCLGSAYQRLPKSVLAESVNNDGKPLDFLISSQRAAGVWSVGQDADGELLLTFPKSEGNNPQSKAVTESVPLEQAATLLATVSYYASEKV